MILRTPRNTFTSAHHFWTGFLQRVSYPNQFEEDFWKQAVHHLDRGQPPSILWQIDLSKHHDLSVMFDHFILHVEIPSPSDLAKIYQDILSYISSYNSKQE